MPTAWILRGYMVLVKQDYDNLEAILDGFVTRV